MRAKIALLLIFMLSACAPSEQAVQTAIAQTQTVWTAVPTQTPYFTQTPYPTNTMWVVTKIAFVTPTVTLTPNFTATASNTPAPTQDPRASNKRDGFYLVNVDILPGIWRSTGSSDNCYWAITSTNGDIINNHFGMSGGTAYIPQTAFQVQFQDCGAWEYIGPP